MRLSGEDWRNIFLAIIAAMTTIITTVGPLLIKYFMDKAAKQRDEAAANVTRLQATADATHGIVNSRYDELKQELEKSNQRVEDLLQHLSKKPRPKADTSSIIAASVPKKLK